MNTTLTRRQPSTLRRGAEALEAKLWPNGEVSIWRPRTFKMPKLVKRTSANMSAYKMSLFHAMLDPQIEWKTFACALGLSLLPIFDKQTGQWIEASETPKPSRTRKGLSGITAYGKRMVRNAAYLLESEGGKARCIFATATLPDVPIQQMAILHQHWHKLIEYYRLGIRRELQNQHLSGEIVTVSEIQEKRYKVSGLPILHIHSVFVGVTSIGKFAISTKVHDDIWHRALKAVIAIEASECTAACNLQRVRKSAASYLGKYMSKGASVVMSVVEKGLGEWLPKHWWNCTRSLASRVKGQTRVVSAFADWLNACAETTANSVWLWHRDVLLQMDSGQEFIVAKYGQLQPGITRQIQAACS